jgi:hypothetical protein
MAQTQLPNNQNNPAAPSSSAGGHFLVPHFHAMTSITGLRVNPANGRVEPVYDARNVRANGQLVALYNAATVTGTFTPAEVPYVTIVAAVKNNDGEDTTLGKAQADKFLAEGRITEREYKEITTEVKPTGDGVKAAPPKTGSAAGTIAGPFTFNTVLTPGGTTLGTMIKAVTFPRTIEQLSQGYPGLTPDNIVNNLAALALNIYEPLKAQFPRAFITNSFRHGASIGGGQHGTGQAMDIQVRGLSSNDYINVAEWINRNLPYDQLLLEYLPNKTVWIHVSYSIPGLPNGGLAITKNKPQNRLATLNGASGGKFVPNLHADIVAAAVPNRVVA